MKKPTASEPDRGDAPRIDEIDRRLRRAYGEPEPPERKAPLDELIFTILSQHTSDGNRDRAWERLKGDGLTWSAIADLPEQEIEERIRVGGLARQKARRIRRILRMIREERGACDLGFLNRLDGPEAVRYLVAFPGIGPKTAACVLLFSLGRPAFPVDTHIHRVMTRLGLLERRTTAERAHEILAGRIPPEIFLTLHLNVIAHGRAVCRAKTPRCPECILDDICPKAL
jgi:endonuclease-3